jgi:hypothetical protein
VNFRAPVDEPKRAPSPIHPGLLHTASRPSSFILDISAKADPELDPWAAARERAVVAPVPAYVRSSESVARQTWSTGPSSPLDPPPQELARPLPAEPTRPPALSVRTSMLARPLGPTSPVSPAASNSPHSSGALPDLGYGPGSAFGGPGSAFGGPGSAVAPGGSQHAPSVHAGAHLSYVSALPYGAYDTHERPEWMPALPPAAQYPVHVRPALGPAPDERRSPTPPRLSPIMWARPEAYRGAK